jgi:hypothetical protein
VGRWESIKQPAGSTDDAIRQPQARNESVQILGARLIVDRGNLFRARDKSDTHYSIGCIPLELASGVARGKLCGDRGNLGV